MHAWQDTPWCVEGLTVGFGDCLAPEHGVKRGSGIRLEIRY